MSVEVENWCLTPLTMGFHPWLFCAVPPGLCRWFVQRNHEGVASSHMDDLHNSGHFVPGY